MFRNRFSRKTSENLFFNWNKYFTDPGFFLPWVWLYFLPQLLRKFGKLNYGWRLMEKYFVFKLVKIPTTFQTYLNFFFFFNWKRNGNSQATLFKAGVRVTVFKNYLLFWQINLEKHESQRWFTFFSEPAGEGLKV